MKTYKVLVFTDHSGHSEHNSIYAILSSMSRHPSCSKVDIASRGNPANNSFFQELSTTKLEVANVGHSFSFDPNGFQFLHNTSEADFHQYDIIFLRLPRPVSDSFLTKLEQLGKHKLFINKPRGIITSSSKSFLLNFPELCPPMKLCRSISDVLDFADLQAIVLKPLREYGGRGLVKISGDILNDGTKDWEALDYLRQIENELKNDGLLAMKYLSKVTLGDKRLLVVNGEILAASLRLPPEGSWLCNIARGGKSEFAEPTKREREIVKTINPTLSELGILIYGVDTLVDDDNQRTLSEINTLSIGGFAQAEQQTGKPVIHLAIQKIFQHADNKYGY